MKLLSCFYDNNEDSCQPKGPTATTEYKSTLIWLLCDFCKDCETVNKNFNNNKKEISCCPEATAPIATSTPTSVSTANTCPTTTDTSQTTCGTTDSETSCTPTAASTSSCSTTASTPTTVSSEASTSTTNCKLKGLKTRLTSASCVVLKNLTSEATNETNTCPCANSEDKIKNFVEKSMENCKMEANELIKEVNAQVIDTKSYEEMESYIKEFSLKILCLLLYKHLVEELILLYNFLDSIIENLSTCDEIKSCSCGVAGNTSADNCCSINGKCLCSIYYKLCHLSIKLHDRYCKIIKYIKGECDEDLSKVIPSLSITRSIYLLTKYFKEYKGKIDEESSCGTQESAAAACCCHKYNSKLDEILTSLCKAIEDDTSDDILPNAIQFVSYVAKDEFSVAKKFNYKEVHTSIKTKTFNSGNNLGCCCCCTKDKKNCCCTVNNGETCCDTGGGQCCQGDNCCCSDTNNGCCCMKGIETTDGTDINLCDCCCKHKDGECKGCDCTQVTDKCYCCCLCGDTSGKCECQTTPSTTPGLKKCCCTQCRSGTETGCCTSCNCQCNQNIKICSCCQCISTDNLISCCDLPPNSTACTEGNCCCCKDCKCEEIKCSDLNGTASESCGKDLQYCCNSNATCNLDICKINCCMRNLTKNGDNNGCLSTIIKDMKNFSDYLGKIKDCNDNGETCTQCTCPDCCCSEDEKQCCDMYCRVKKMFTQIFNTSTRNGNGYKGEPVSICNGSKCIFCILCCLKNNAESIQTNYKKCNAAGCCNITSTCNNTNTTTGCTASGNTACTTTTGSCNTTTEGATVTCQCQQICNGCTDPNCCNSEGSSSCSICKISPSSIFTCIKKLYLPNVRFIERLTNVITTHLISHHNSTLLLIIIITINHIYTLSALVKLHLKHLPMIDNLALLTWIYKKILVIIMSTLLFIHFIIYI